MARSKAAEQLDPEQTYQAVTCAAVDLTAVDVPVGHALYGCKDFTIVEGAKFRGDSPVVRAYPGLFAPHDATDEEVAERRNAYTRGGRR